MTELERLRSEEAIRAVAAAEARYRVAERPDAELQLDARHSEQPDPGYPATDKAPQALSAAIALEQATALALEQALHEASRGRPAPQTTQGGHR